MKVIKENRNSSIFSLLDDGVSIFHQLKLERKKVDVQKRYSDSFMQPLSIFFYKRK